MLYRMYDEQEFLSPYGIRSLSKYHEQHPFSWDGRTVISDAAGMVTLSVPQQAVFVLTSLRLG